MKAVYATIVLVCAISAYTVDAEETAKAVAMPEGTRFTQNLHNLEVAAGMLRKHIHHQEPYSPPNDPHVHYLMIVNALNQLFEYHSKGYIGLDYYDIVNRAIMETFKNPQKAADQVRVQIYKTLSKITALKDLIERVQSNGECEHKISYECDLIIELAIKMSGDALLKQQAHYFGTLAHEVSLFLTQYSAEFEDISNAKNAPAYLIKGAGRLAPLILAGTETRKQRQDIQPLGNRRFGGGYM